MENPNMLQHDVGWGMGMGQAPMGWLFWLLVVIGLVFFFSKK